MAARRKAQHREAPEMGAMLGRMMRAMARRAGDGDLDALVELAALRDKLDDALVAGARAAHDGPMAYSWTEIGTALGITRQAARQRFGGGE